MSPLRCPRGLRCRFFLVDEPTTGDLVHCRSPTRGRSRPASSDPRPTSTHDLAEAGRVVVTSTSPFGIDDHAARAAFAAGGRLLAVAGRGLDESTERTDPAVHPLLDAPAGRGAIVSPFPSGAQPTLPRTAVARRLLGTLTPAVVIVEAARHGGTLTVARAAAETGRTVGAVPGPVTSALSAGCHDLIATQGARLVASADDILTLAPDLPSDVPHGTARVAGLYQITATASWDDGHWRTRRVPVFYVTADSHHAAADTAYEVVFAARPYPSGDTLTAGLLDPTGAYEALEVSSTT
ncbi:DNA-processing protein DprA [Dactylosporangium sp. NPDC000521]|uniref:DNA-processing protein DprA n=1 Tax=Dactylosporangium sp. NPDC000521 TaxID=3363975 RepID=UPI00367B36C9